MSIEFLTVNKESDLELILSWRSNPMIYKWFKIQKEPLLWSNHFAYWQDRSDGEDYIIIYNNRKVGLISFNAVDFTSKISIMIGEVSLWGEGIGKKALICFLLSPMIVSRVIIAEIKEDNISSRKLFEHCGFVLESSFSYNNEKWMNYVFYRSDNENSI